MDHEIDIKFGLRDTGLLRREFQDGVLRESDIMGLGADTEEDWRFKMREPAALWHVCGRWCT